MKATIGLISTTLTILAASPVATADDVSKVPEYNEFIVVPLRVHVLTSKKLELANCTITDAEVARVVAGISMIWSKAGIHFGLESIVREEPVQVEQFNALLKSNQGRRLSLDKFAGLLPSSSQVVDGLDVYVFHELPLNGQYIDAARAEIVMEKPRLRPVNGGTDNLVARVAAHGLGRALSLSVRKDEVGLLSLGTTGIGLSEVEVGRARQTARTIRGAKDVDAVAAEAAAAVENRDLALARRLWTWLSEIPGAGAAEAKKQLSALPATAKP